MELTSGMVTLASIANLSTGTGAGGLLALIGWIWLIVMGFQQGRQWWWGLVVLLIPPIGPLVFGIVKWPGTKVPFILFVVGLILGGALSWG